MRTPATGRRPGRPAGRRADAGPLVDRATLLAAAERRIRLDGPSVTLDAIAGEAGVTKPILYRGVGDKDAVVRALAERLADRIADEIARAVAAVATGPRDQLRQLVATFLDVTSTDRNVYLYVTAGGSGDDRVAEALRLADRSAAPLAAALAEMRRARGTDPAVAQAWAYALVGMLHFVSLWWLRDETVSRDTLADQIVELLWDGLRGG